MFKGQKALGVVLILVSSSSFGFVPTFANIAFDSGANPVGVSLSRFVAATTLMLLVRHFTSRAVEWPEPRLFIQLFLLGAICYFVSALLYFTAIDHIDSGLAIVIFYCNPLIVVALAWVFHGTKPTKYVVACLVFTMVGVTITAGEVGNADAMSIVLVLIVAVVYSFYTIGASQILPRTDLITGVTIVMFGAAFSFVGYWLIAPLVSTHSVTANFPTTPIGWIGILLLTTVSTVFATATFYAGLKRVGSGKTSIITTFEPVAAIFAGVLFLGEPLTVTRIIGATFVIGSVVTLAATESRSEAIVVHQ